MAVPKKKTSKTRRDTRRAHDALTAPGVSICPQCKEPKQSHRVCPSCGTYKGREIISTEK
jgi:large subunit ribosomal protein L32